MQRRWRLVRIGFPETVVTILTLGIGQIVYVGGVIYSFAIPLPKLVILLFYMRIFPNSRIKFAIYSVAIFVIAWCPAVLLVNIFQCNPIKFYWNKSIKGGTCIDILAYWRYSSVPIILSDIAILVIPLPMIWRLQMTTRRKLAVSGVFLTGSLSLIGSLVRIGMFFMKRPLMDSTWNSAILQMWKMVEVEAVLIAACLPLLKPLFVSFWQSSVRLGSKMHLVSKIQTTPDGGLQKQGFTRIENNGGILRTWEVELMPMQSMPSPKDGQGVAFP